MLFPVALVLLAVTTLLTDASPIKRQTPISTAEIASYKPYTFYAKAAACQPSTTLAWNCGASCNANPTFIPLASGGNGATIQYWYVGWDPTLRTLVVGHQGTDSSKIIPVLTNANIALIRPSTTLFPGLASNIRVHAGFAESQADTATRILALVRDGITRFGATKVTVTGHSLGAAIALLDAVYLPLHLPSNISVSYIGYGAPRVGNDQFADYVDSHLQSVIRINNNKDIVPILPGRFLGFRHVSGERHILGSGEWVSCPGQDNTNALCTVGTVRNIFEGEPNDHSGPYDGVRMGC